MEKVPAACAMEWSIELEKGLRSKRPGQPVEVIEQIGSQLLKWSKESSISMSASRMYGLVPGEERSFANTILMRLADAFRSGDNCVRACILKVFLLELTHIKEKGRSYDGILTKERLPNYLELLKRVRFAFDTGDVKARALSLRLLGCWAPLTHDNADVRYIILLSLRSDHVLEVKASLFASGCLCRLSDDFACIFLGILVDIICSVVASSSVKLAAVCAFGEIQCSSLVASKAFKSGKKLVLKSQIEDHMVEMLSSLSKLAVKSVTLIPEQVDVLLSFLSQECAPAMKSMALKCIRLLSLCGFSHSLINRNVLSTLIHKIDDPDLPLDLQCDILKTLRKLFNGLPKTYYGGIPEFPMLVMIVEHASQSPYTTKRYMAIDLLVDISCHANISRKGSWSCIEKLSIEYASCQSQVSSENLFSFTNDPVLLARYVILLLIKHITSMTKNMGIETERGTVFLGNAGFSEAACEVKQKYSILFNHILRMIVEYPVLGLMVLGRFRNLIEDLVHFHPTFIKEASYSCDHVSEMEIDVEKPNNVSKFCKSDRGNHAVSEIVLNICGFVIPCLNVLDENGLAGAEVCAVLKLLVDCFQKAEFYNLDVCEMVSFQISSSVTSLCCGIKDNTMQMLRESKLGVNPNLSEDNCWVPRERLAHEFARRMMNRRKYWMIYRSGKYSSHEGLWFAASYAFRGLLGMEKSDSCCRWLKCLVLLAGAETEMRLLLFPKLGTKLISEQRTDGGCGIPCEDVQDEGMENSNDGIAFMCDKREKLSRVHRRICSSEVILPVVGTLTGAFWFQHLFLNLRGKVFQILLDILGHLNSHLNNEKTLDSHGPEKQNLGLFSSLSGEDVNFLTSHFSCISLQLNQLARAYDFLTSFMDMDLTSSRMISRLALCCSLLALCAGFPVYLSGLSCYEGMISNSGCFGNSLSVLLEDLVGRLCYLYGMSAIDLESYMLCGAHLRGCLISGEQISRFDHMDASIIFVSRFAISSFHHLQEEAKGARHKEDICHMFRKGLQLLCNILVKWMHFPFQMPKYFFRVRHCRGAELFVHNSDIGNPGKLCVLLGNQLSLDLCIQLKNISPEYRARISKIYCILAARSSGPVSEGNKRRERENFTGFQAWKTEEIIHLNELLLSYVECETKKSYKMQGVPNEVDLVTTRFCVEPNEQGQGFSTCLLDVSALSVGAYQIKWHCCCVDKNDNYWSLPALNDAILFTIKGPSAT